MFLKEQLHEWKLFFKYMKYSVWFWLTIMPFEHLNYETAQFLLHIIND